MRRLCAALCLPLVWDISVGRAEETGSVASCLRVAQELWSGVATAPLRAQTPLAELPAIKRGTTDIVGAGLAKAGQSIAAALTDDHAAEPELAQKLHDTPPAEAMRFGDSDVWLLDRAEGSLGCHMPMTVAVPPDGPAHMIALPGTPDPTALCGLSALTTVMIGENPALWIEQSGGFSSSLGQSTVSITALNKEMFAPPCTVTIDYVVADRAAHAFCDGVDCVPLERMGEILAMRLRQEETAGSLGAGVIRNEDEAAQYRRMADLAAAAQQPAELPTFGASVDTPYVTFADQALFPLRLDDGAVYLGRLGHGGFGWRQTADTLLAVYRLRDDRLMPVASVYVSARRTGIQAVTVQ